MVMIRPRVIDHGLMDAEHRTINQWVQTAVELMQNGHDMGQALYALDALRNLAVSHFEHEFREMQAMGYPQGLAHARDHEDMLGELSRIRRAVKECAAQGAGEQCSAIAERLLRWFHAHIGGYDRQFASWLHNRSATSSAAERAGHGGQD